MNGHRLLRGRIVERTATALISAALLTVFATAAATQPAGAAIGPFTVSPPSGPAGTPVTVSGSGCSPGLFTSSSDYVSISSMTLRLNQHASVSSGGSWSATFTVPQGSPPIPALIVAACVTDGLPSLTTIYTPGTFRVTAATPTTSAPPTVPATTPTTRGTAATTRATSSTTKAGGKGGNSSSAPGTGASTGGSSGRSSGTAGRGDGANPVVAAGVAGSVAADRRSGAEAGLRSPSLASDTSSAAGGMSWWWWLVVAALVGAAIGTAFWAWHRLRPAPTEPSGDDHPEGEPAADDDPLGDDWIEHSVVDDVPSVSR